MRNGSPRSGGTTPGGIVDHTRVRLRTAILRWLRLENEAIGAQSTTRQLRRVAWRMSPRWVWKGMALLLRGETAILRQHVASIVQHEVNAEHRARQAAQPPPEDASRPSAEARDRARAVDTKIGAALGQSSDSASRTILIALPFLILGGADRLVSQVVGHLVRRGYRVIVVTTLHVGSEYGDTTPWFEAHTREVYHLPRLLEGHLWRDFVLELFETRRVSLLWIIGSAFFYDLLPTLKDRYPHLKVIDLLFNTVGHTANNRKYASYFDRIVVENGEVAAWLVAAGESPARVTRIESGVDLSRYYPREKSPDLLRQLGLPAHAFIAGYSGRLADEKNPLACVAIADLLRSESSIFLVMTGAGPLADELRSRVAREGLEKRLLYVGAVPEVIDYLALYDVLLLPSKLDGRPNAVLESLAMGVPVIASRVGALPELIAEGVTGFLCVPGEVDQFAAHIRWLASHPGERRAMGSAARAFAERHLDAVDMCSEYESLLEELLGAGQRAAGGAAPTIRTPAA